MKKRGIAVLLAVGSALCLSACVGGFTTEDAQNQVKSALDASYKADCEEYVEQTNSTQEEAEAMFQQTIDNVLAGIGLEEEGVSDELVQPDRDVADDLLGLANYEVTGAEETEDGFAVEVAYEPFVGYDNLNAGLETVLTDIASTMTEVPRDEEHNKIIYAEILKLVQQMEDEPSYGEQENFTIHINKDSGNVYTINEDDLVALELAMFSGE